MSTAADILGSNRKPKAPAKWAAHFRRLIHERNRLLARNFSSPAPSAVKMDDSGDAATEETQRTLAFVAAGARQETVFEVLEAIRRIECGTYGICEVTGEPIQEARLQAIPGRAPRCGGNRRWRQVDRVGGEKFPLWQSLVEAELTSEPESEEPEREQAV